MKKHEKLSIIRDTAVIKAGDMQVIEVTMTTPGAG